MALRLDEHDEEGIDAIGFFPTRSTKNKRLVSSEVVIANEIFIAHCQHRISPPTVTS